MEGDQVLALVVVIMALHSAVVAVLVLRLRRKVKDLRRELDEHRGKCRPSRRVKAVEAGEGADKRRVEFDTPWSEGPMLMSAAGYSLSDEIRFAGEWGPVRRQYEGTPVLVYVRQALASGRFAAEEIRALREHVAFDCIVP